MLRVDDGNAQIDGGGSHACAVTSAGHVYCWGADAAGQSTTPPGGTRVVYAVRVGALEEAVEVSAGSGHSCARFADGSARCWGGNGFGQLGDGTTQNHATAVEVGGGLRFSEIHAGGAQTCARTTDGTEYGGGLNNSGQLGDGTRESRSVPTRVGM